VNPSGGGGIPRDPEGRFVLDENDRSPLGLALARQGTWETYTFAIIGRRESFFARQEGENRCLVRYLTSPGLYEVLEHFDATGEWIDKPGLYVFQTPP
jgi:hypothetical protein